jgi:hypothetical protein
MRKSLVGVFACAAVVLAGSAAMAADHWMGTWKLDAAKSKYGSAPAPKSMTVKWEAAAGGMTHFTGDTVGADGKEAKSEYTSAFDGKDVAYTGNPNADTAAPKRVDDDNYTNVWKMKGKATVTATVTVAKDGKSLTVTQKGTDAKGQAVTITAVFDRQ